MSLTEFEEEKVRVAMDGLISKVRPPEPVRNEVDVTYRIHGQSVEIMEIRDRWDNPGEKIEVKVAKATYVRKQGVWKVFWQRADLKWHRYVPHPTAKNIDEFVAIVDQDECACFWG